MITSSRLTALVAATLTALAAATSAGPQDQVTKYPIDITVGGQTVSGLADSGGTTTLSFADAKKMGLLNDSGDPVNPPDSSVGLGGTGGGSVKCHVFRNVSVTVQPKKADGTNNGPARTTTVTVFVPKKPSDQEGENDAAKSRKTNSVPTKAGANICGATIDGHKLDFTDRATENPRKNLRSTGWRSVGGGGGGGGGEDDGEGDDDTDEGDRRSPTQEDDNYEDEAVFEPVLPGFLVNGQPCWGTLSMGPITAFGQHAAQQFGVIPEEQVLLDFESHALLFLAGATDIVPDQDAPIWVQSGHCFIELPTLEGDFVIVEPTLAYIMPDGDPWKVVIGANGVMPAESAWWLESSEGVIVWDLDLDPAPCRADLNEDGVVNTLDYLEFLNLWNARDPLADWNNDGRINTLDFLAFQNDWAGCR